MKLAIVGSRSLAGNARAQEIIEEVFDTYNVTLLISGGAIGIDRMAEHEALSRGIRTQIFKPKRAVWAPSGFKERNKLIAEACQVLVCIGGVPRASFGSAWTADYARSLGKPVEEYLVSLPVGGER